MNLNLTVVRYIALGAIALVTFALLLVIALTVARGLPPNASGVAGLIALVGVLVGILGNLSGTSTLTVAVKNVGGQLDQVEQKVNGHLAAHLVNTEDQVLQLVDKRLVERGLMPQSPQAPQPKESA